MIAALLVLGLLTVAVAIWRGQRRHRGPDRAGARPGGAGAGPVSATLPGTRPRAGGVPARRAVMRWGWRLFRREWRQQLLVLGLLTVAVAATIWGASVVTNAQLPNPNYATLGTAAASVTLPGTDPSPGRRHRRDPGPLGAGRSHRGSGHRYRHHPACAAPRGESARALQRSAAQPGQRQLPGRPRPGRADQPGRGPVRHARGRHLAGGRGDLAGDRHRARPEQPGGRVRAGCPGPGHPPQPGGHAARLGRGAAGDQRRQRDAARCPGGDCVLPHRQRGRILAGDGRPGGGGTRPGVHRPGVGSRFLA